MKLRPLGDRVILKYQEAEEKTRSGIILPDSKKCIRFHAFEKNGGAGLYPQGKGFL